MQICISDLSLDIIIELIYLSRIIWRIMYVRQQDIDLHAHYVQVTLCFVNQVFPIDQISSDQIQLAYFFYLFYDSRTMHEWIYVRRDVIRFEGAFVCDIHAYLRANSLMYCRKIREFDLPVFSRRSFSRDKDQFSII